MIVAESPKGETLRVELLEVLADHSYDLGDDPGLEKDGVEAELQQLIAGPGRRAAGGLHPGATGVPDRHRPGRPAVPRR